MFLRVQGAPPKLYGGTERIVSYLTEELVRQGHDVTLFASGDFKTLAKLVPCCDMALRLNPSIMDSLPYHIMMIEQVRQQAHEFDILHFHLDYLHAPLVRQLSRPALTTHHGRLDLPDLARFYEISHDMPLVSISNDQRGYLRQAHWIGTVHHRLHAIGCRFSLLLAAVISCFSVVFPGKAARSGDQIAAKAGVPLKIAAKVNRVDQDYWDEKIQPMVRAHSNVEFIGEINEDEKAELLGKATALLFPIDWPEPFGLVMIEAMAYDTPVIALRRG